MSACDFNGIQLPFKGIQIKKDFAEIMFMFLFFWALCSNSDHAPLKCAIINDIKCLPGDKYSLHISRQSSSVWSSIWSLFCSLISCGLGFKIYPTFPLWDLQNLSHRNQNLNSYVRNQLSTLFLIKKQ